MFVDSIAQFRGVSVDTVLADMADGRVFLGQQAVAAGLVDGVSTMADLIAQLNQDRMTWKPGAGAASSPQKPTSQEESMKITREQLAADAPELLTAILAEGKAEGEASGAQKELARVKGCLEASAPGYEAIAEAAAFDGKSTPGEAALAVLKAQNADLAKAHADAGNPERGAPVLPATDDPAHAEAEAQRKQVEEEAAKKNAAHGPDDAHAHADAIRTHIAAEAAKGRRITAAQASQELSRKGKE